MPDILRYVQCELPEDLTQSLINFQVSFDELGRFYGDQFDEFVTVDLPEPLAQLDELIDLTEQLMQGSPVPELSSFAAMEESLKLSNPKADPKSPESISLDERKMGAAGICLLNGRTFAIATGNKIEALRNLWEATGGEYNAFIVAGDGLMASPQGSFVLYEFNPSTGTFPFVDKRMEDLESITGYAPSLFKFKLFWNTAVNTSAGSYNKLLNIGYTDDQLSAIFSGGQPTKNYDFVGKLREVQQYLKSLAKVLLLSPTDPLRQPKWVNEANFLELALRSFLDWRLNSNLASYSIDATFWDAVKSTLFPEDMKELFENRPEIKNLVLPVDDTAMEKLLTKAVSAPTNNPLINTYMLSLPEPKKADEISHAVYNIGLLLWQRFRVEYESRAPIIEKLLLELKGSLVPLTPLDMPPPTPDMNLWDMKKVINEKTTNALTEQPGMTNDPEVAPAQNKVTSSSNPPPEAVMADTMKQAVDASEDPEAAKAAMSAAAQANKFATSADKQTNKKGKVQGFDSAQDFASILGSKINWSKNGLDCTGKKIVENNVGKKTTASTSTVQKTANQNSYSAKDKKKIVYTQGEKPNKVKVNFEMKCVPKIENQFTKFLADAESKFRKWLVSKLNYLKAVLMHAQEVVDDIIIKIQLILDMWIGKLQKWLTIDIAIGGKLGFDTGLIKCAWSFDFKLKLDILGYLLGLLAPYLKMWFSPLFKLQRMIKEFLQSVICPVVRLIEAILGAANALLNLIGCSLKDINFPTEFLDLLGLIMGSFNLRQLILRGATDKLGEIALNMKKNNDKFKGLQQFAAFCQNAPGSAVADKINKFMTNFTSDLPLKSSSSTFKIDPMTIASKVMG